MVIKISTINSIASSSWFVTSLSSSSCSIART